jgi:hypothetical protein
MKEIIYLVGQISIDAPETYHWRERVVEYFKDYPQFQLINPCGNSFNTNIKKELGNGKDVYRTTVFKTKVGYLIIAFYLLKPPHTPPQTAPSATPDCRLWHDQIYYYQIVVGL